MMKLNPVARAVGLTTLGLALTLPMAAQAAFIEDSKASLELRNFYMNKDWRNEGTRDPAREWAQGFIFKYESGYTEGTVGFGLDLHGFAGFKLDSGRGSHGTGLLLTKPRNDKGRDGGHVPNSYGHAGATAKAKISETVLKGGTLRPSLPTVRSHDGRINPVTFSGVHVNSKEVNNLTLDIGQLGRVTQRNSTNSEPLAVGIAQGVGVNKFKNNKPVRRATKWNKSSRFDFAGASYKWGDSGLTTSYNYANLDEVYKQHILNGVYTYKLTDTQSITTDLRYAKTSEDGKSGIDNKAVSGMVIYKLGHNSFAASYQKMSGDTGYAYLSGTDPFLTNFVQARDFASKDEKSWQVRYTHDFASIGLPGLSLMTRYVKGSNIYMGQGEKRGREWERDIDLGYVIQDGTLKGLGMKVRNATVRDNMKRKNDETRVIVSYTIPLL